MVIPLILFTTKFTKKSRRRIKGTDRLMPLFSLGLVGPKKKAQPAASLIALNSDLALTNYTNTPIMPKCSAIYLNSLRLIYIIRSFC